MWSREDIEATCHHAGVPCLAQLGVFLFLHEVQGSVDTDTGSRWPWMKGSRCSTDSLYYWMWPTVKRSVTLTQTLSPTSPLSKSQSCRSRRLAKLQRKEQPQIRPLTAKIYK